MESTSTNTIHVSEAPRDTGSSRFAPSPTVNTRHASEQWYPHQMKPLPATFTMERIELKMKQYLLSRDVVLYIPFLIMFTFFFLYGKSLGSGYFVVKAARDMMLENEFPNIEVKKTFDNIAHAQDFFDWLSGVAILNIWNEQFDQTLTYEGNRVRYSTGLNQLLGALRIRTLRIGPQSCPKQNSRWYPDDDSFPRVCYGVWAKKDENSNPMGPGGQYKYNTCEDLGGATTTGRVSRYHCGGYVHDIPFNVTQSQAEEEVAKLRLNSFINNYDTRFVMVEFFSYTPAFNIFTGWKLFAEVTAGGAWWPNVQFQNFLAWKKTNIGILRLFDLIFLVYVLYYWIRFIMDVKYEWVKGQLDPKVGGFRSVLGHFTQLWNLVDLVNLTTFLIVFAVQFKWWTVSRNLPADYVLPFSPAYPVELDSVLLWYQTAIYLNSLNTVLSFLKLLKYVQLNNRFNILSRTLSEASQDLFGVLVLLFFIVTGYAITGLTIYGNALEDFRDLNTSFSTLLRMLLGDFDYVAMRDENNLVTFTYFWSYMILGLFLVLNFIIAIIAEAFAKVSGAQNDIPVEEQLLRQMEAMRAISKPRGGWVSSTIDFFLARQATMLTHVTISLAVRVRDHKEAMQRAKDEAGVDPEKFHPEYDAPLEVTRDDLASSVKKYVAQPRFNDLLNGLWEGFHRAHDDLSKSPEETSRKDKEEVLYKAVDAATSSQLEILPQLESTMDQLAASQKALLMALNAPLDDQMVTDLAS